MQKKLNLVILKISQKIVKNFRYLERRMNLMRLMSSLRSLCKLNVNFLNSKTPTHSQITEKICDKVREYSENLKENFFFFISSFLF